LVFEEKGKPEYPEKNLLEQGRQPTTNNQPITHWWEASALTTAHYYAARNSRIICFVLFS